MSLPRVVIAFLALAAPLPALAGGCPLGRSVLEPVDAPGAFTMRVVQEGHGYRFAPTGRASLRTTRFSGSHQNGTGHLVLDEDVAEPKPGTEDVRLEGITSRAMALRADLRTADPWSKRPAPIAYVVFEGLATALWDRSRFNAEDDRPGAAPPDGLWRVRRCAR